MLDKFFIHEGVLRELGKEMLQVEHVLERMYFRAIAKMYPILNPRLSRAIWCADTISALRNFIPSLIFYMHTHLIA